MLKAILLAALASLFVSSQPVATNCDTKSAFQVDQISIEYELPPVNSTLTVAYTVPETIEDGLSKFACTLNGIPVLNDQKPLCQDTVCPIVAGFHNDSNPFETALTSGTLSCTTKWLRVDGSVLRCIKIVETS